MTITPAPTPTLTFTKLKTKSSTLSLTSQTVAVYDRDPVCDHLTVHDSLSLSHRLDDRQSDSVSFF